MNRKCYICKEIKEVTLFSKDKTKSLGYSYRCKKCCNKISKKYREEHLDYFKDYLKKYSKTYTNKLGKDYFRNYWKTHKKNLKTDKVRARVKLNRKVSMGVINKLPCVICGNIKSEAHHNNYLKPFEVIWLCKKHHTDLHNSLR